MPQTDTRSLHEIKRETEQTRAGLTNTVEQLKTSVAETASDIRHRISPDTIKAEVSGYIKTRGEQLLNDVTAAARRNPMQAVAVGASVALPLLRLARAIPLPVLMMGAGLFFASSKTGQAATQKASDAAAELADQVGRRARELGDQAGEQASAAKAYVSDQLDRASTAVAGGSEKISHAANAAAQALPSGQQVQDRAASIGGALSQRAENLKDDSLRMAGSAAATVQDLASGVTTVARNVASSTVDAGMDAAQAVRDRASQLADSGMDTAKAARDRASEIADQAGKTIFQTIEQNPLLVAGVGLLVGGLIASALPRSEIEDDLVGNASTRMKRRAQAAASQGLEAVTSAAGEIYDETTRQAGAEGLTPNAVGEAVRDIGQRVRRVAEKAVTTAFDPAKDTHQENHQPSNQGASDNG